MPQASWNKRADKLREHLGSHSAVARSLGITIRHWMGLRKNPDRIMGTVARLIRLQCKIIDLAGGYSAFRKNLDTLIFDPKDR
ncbi:hypothetical protein KAR91_80795 [Candidatus Pacearchaeota archaeon]|nr:hypothetical protein [Candidatus Pacearchaeota archaeon]